MIQKREPRWPRRERASDPDSAARGDVTQPDVAEPIERFIEEFVRQPSNVREIEWIRTEDARPPSHAEESGDGSFYGLDPRWRDYLRTQGIERLYSHQKIAIDRVREGRGAVVVVSATASGKSLCYNLPILDQFLKEESGYALYLFPTKALAQDQMRVLDGHIRGLGWPATD